MWGLFDGEGDGDFFDGFFKVVGDGVAVVAGGGGADLFDCGLRRAKLGIGDGLLFMAFAVAANVATHEIAGGFDGVHGFDAVAFVIVISKCEGFVGSAKCGDFGGVVSGSNGIRQSEDTDEGECHSGSFHRFQPFFSRRDGNGNNYHNWDSQLHYFQ